MDRTDTPGLGRPRYAGAAGAASSPEPATPLPDRPAGFGADVTAGEGRRDQPLGQEAHLERHAGGDVVQHAGGLARGPGAPQGAQREPAAAHAADGYLPKPVKRPSRGRHGQHCWAVSEGSRP